MRLFMFGEKQHSEISDTLLQTQETGQQWVRSRWRLKLLKAVLLFAFLGIVVRLIQIQIVESPKFQEIAQKQYETKVIVPAVRGNIYDRNGNVLASNSMFVSFAADPKAVGGHTWKISERFSRIFNQPAKYYLEKLENDKRFVWLERQIRPELARRVQVGTLPGIIELHEPKRLYHYPEIGGALVGFTDVDNSGLSGMELQFDEQLRGMDGYVIMQRDGLGQSRPSTDYLRVESQDGNDIVLTIDLVYQSIAEEKLKKGIERTQSSGGLVIIMVPSTGEVLAMAQYPPLDPTSPASTDVQYQRLRAVTDVFEPGSVFKIVIAAAALEERVVRPDQRFYAEHGTYTVKLPDGRIRVIRDTHDHDRLTFQQAMEVSSNIVMAKVSDIVGSERLYKKARAFGFGGETGIEYPGETKGDLKLPAQWSGTTLNTMAYGYEVGVTPLQIAAAYCAIANNGLLMKPKLVRKITAKSGTVIEERIPEPVRQVVTKEVASTLRKFFEGTVERGTGTPAKITGFRTGGKTGTSRKYVQGQYQTGNYTASFVGFFPVDHPEIVCVVMLDNPRVGGYTGGSAAAPIFKNVVQQIITTGKTIIPTSNSVVLETNHNDKVGVPDVVGLQSDVARKVLESRGLRAEMYGDGIVVKQAPKPKANVDRASKVTLVLNGQQQKVANNRVIVPDLRGLSVRRAVNRLAVDKFETKIHGSGIVIDQIPSPGTTASVGASILLVCEPRAFAEIKK